MTKEELLESKLKEISDLSLLDPGWDGDGSCAVRQETIRSAMRFLNIGHNIMPIEDVDISPNSNGTVGMEWRTANGFAYVEVGMSTFGWLVKTAEEAWPVDIVGNTEDINDDFIRHLFSKTKALLFDGINLKTE